MSRFIDANELKKHIRHNLLGFGKKDSFSLEQCRAIDAVIDAETEIKVFDRDTGAEPVLEEKTSICHEAHADGHGGFKEVKFLDWMCPQCGWFVGELYCGSGRWHIQGQRSYCSKCGQAIDWSKPKAEEKKRYEETKAKERESYFSNNGIQLDNMNEGKRKKYGMLGAEE